MHSVCHAMVLLCPAGLFAVNRTKYSARLAVLSLWRHFAALPLKQSPALRPSLFEAAVFEPALVVALAFTVVNSA
jgi:hypothetical protein